jgi:outer membrane protein assembly factor BamB
MNERLACRCALILFGILAFQVPCNSQGYSTGDPIWTQHNDNGRTGAFLDERRITVASLGSQGMRLVAPPTDVGDDIETQVLYVPRIATRNSNNAIVTANVAYVTTLGNNVFAIDADTGTILWKTPLPRDRSQYPPGGIHSTPVIDLNKKLSMWCTAQLIAQLQDRPRVKVRFGLPCSTW